jgi:chemotaxis protein MotB
MTIGRTNEVKLLMDIRDGLKGCHEAVVPYQHPVSASLPAAGGIARYESAHTHSQMEGVIMRGIKTSILAVSVLAFAGTAGAVDWTAICCDGGYEYRHPNAWEKEQQRIKDELAAAQKQLADRERELASLRAGAGDSSRLASQLSSTQGELAQAKARISDLEKSLAAAGAGASASEAASRENARLAAELAAANNEKDRLASELAALKGSEGDKDKLAGDLAAANRRIAELEKQMADRDKELASLRGDLSAEMAKLKEAQRGLVRALRPQIEKGDITVDLNNERLLINLASGYLFGTGEDELKPAGANALKQVGAVLKDFPEYKVAVDGHTDNVAIRTSLRKKFPTNKELSEARAANAAKALAEGGRGDAKTTGYADSKPVEPNTTAAGRAMNRRVEVRVTR